jgi:hypothetical protein
VASGCASTAGGPEALLGLLGLGLRRRRLLERGAGALDGLRQRALRQVMRHEALRRVFVSPSLRLSAVLLGSTALAAVLGFTAPLYTLWLGAALLGVPHVASGLRHLLAHGGATAATRACALLGVAVGAAQLLGAGDWTFVAFAALFAASAAAEVLAARRSLAVTAAWLVPIAVGGALAAARPVAFVLVFLHLHALTSLGIFALKAQRRGVTVWPVLGLAAALAAAVAAGALDGLLPRTLWAPRWGGRSVVLEAASAAWAHPSGAGLRRALFLYVFGQQLHFVTWLRLVPELDRPSPVPYSFRRAVQALRRDLGGWAGPTLALAVLGAAGVLWGGGAGREAYFALTYFHLGLEAAALTRLLVRPAQAMAWRQS